MSPSPIRSLSRLSPSRGPKEEKEMTVSTTTTTRTRDFPRPVAIFFERCLFTTLTDEEVLAGRRKPYIHPGNGRLCHLFSLDSTMKYLSFSMDHGPLNLAMTFTACTKIHDLLEDEALEDKAICLYTNLEAATKSNMTLMIALYFLIVARRTPSQAFQPVASLEVMPFRDAGSGPMDFGLSIQDCLYGVHKAIENNLLDLPNFDPEFYTYYEIVENGDLNILGPFIPFASPVEPEWQEAIKEATTGDGVRNTAGPLDQPPTKTNNLPLRFKKVLNVFTQENVGVVVRLNDELYDRRHFVKLGMDHVDLYFDDGSNPSDQIVREFICLSEAMIEGKGKKVAVHCKAGLGRTGVLIGAYLIYKYQFSAQEVIGLMRIVRPGMVVGPQQQYMTQNQMKWAGWAVRDALLRDLGIDESAITNPLAAPPIDAKVPLFTTSSAAHIYAETTSSSVVGVMHPDDMTATIRAGSKRISTITTYQSSPARDGDAAGQPRKTTTRPAYIDVTTPEDKLSHRRLITPTRPISPIEAHTPPLDDFPQVPSSPLVSPRGIKRGSRARTPLGRQSSNTTLHSSPPRGTLSIPSNRSLGVHPNTSSYSITSVDERPTKRRVGGESRIKSSGLSSPPPSRESTPADIEEIKPLKTVMEDIKMESKIDLSTPYNNDRQVGDIRSLDTSKIPTRRSLLPKRSSSIPTSVPYPPKKPQQNSVDTKKQSLVPSLSTSKIPVTPSLKLKKNQPTTPIHSRTYGSTHDTTDSKVVQGEKKIGRRVIGISTPKFASDLWGQIGRKSGSTPPS